jgi:hypothetical protein
MDHEGGNTGLRSSESFGYRCGGEWRSAGVSPNVVLIGSAPTAES